MSPETAQLAFGACDSSVSKGYFQANLTKK